MCKVQAKKQKERWGWNRVGFCVIRHIGRDFEDLLFPKLAGSRVGRVFPCCLLSLSGTLGLIRAFRTALVTELKVQY